MLHLCFTEKLDKTFSYRGKRMAKRWYKRATRRAMRRNNRLLDDAPKKNYYHGWFW